MAAREELINRDALTWPYETLEVLSSKELLALVRAYPSVLLNELRWVELGQALP